MAFTMFRNFLTWDLKSKSPVVYSTEDLKYARADVRPALSGTFNVTSKNGKKIPCETVWERLTHVVEAFPPETVEEITWVPKEQITEAARTYAMSKPAVLMSHMGTTMQTNVIQTSRLLSLLIAITGNFDAKDGNGVVQYPIDSYLVMSSKVLRADRKVEEKQIGAAEYPLFAGPDIAEAPSILIAA